MPTEELSTVEADVLQFMREEEKLAHDVYVNLYERWGVQIFTNIAQSEQRHTDAIKCLLDKYGLADPAEELAEGVFSNPDLGALYLQLVALGNQSLADAYQVGATIEDLDIKDLQDLAATVDNQDIIAVFAALERGSRNHLRAFTKQILAAGSTYTPLYISTVDYEVIIASPTERGGGLCSTSNGQNTSGNGNCQGNGVRPVMVASMVMATEVAMVIEVDTKKPNTK
ncbi:MAG: DUF2202 domain-containing protein [Saprospiraceae bacterium]